MLTLQQIAQARMKGVPQDQIDAYMASDGKTTTAPTASSGGTQRSFAGEILPSVFGIGGGILGGIGGTAVGGPVGTVVGGVAGAGAGQALGETVQQGIEKAYNQRPSFDTPQIAGSGVIGAGSQLIGGGVSKIAGLGLKVARPSIVGFLSKFSGYADDVVKAAMDRTPGTIAAIKGGEKVLNDIVKSTAAKISEHSNASVQESKAFLDSLAKRLPQQTGTTDIKPFVNDMLSKTAADLSTAHKVGADLVGKTLNFAREHMPSRIVSDAEKSTVQQGFNDLKSIANDQSIHHIDSIMQRLIDLSTKTPAGTVTGPETKAVIDNMIDNVHIFLKSIPENVGGATYKDYAAHLDNMLLKRVSLSHAQEIFGSSAHPSPMDVSTITKKLLQIYNTGNTATREFADTVGTKIKNDITGAAAGTLMNVGDNQSMRATELSARGITKKIVQAVPRSVLRSYALTGKMTGDLNKAVKVFAKGTGFTSKVILQDIVNLMANKTSDGDSVAK